MLVSRKTLVQKSGITPLMLAVVILMNFLPVFRCFGETPESEDPMNVTSTDYIEYTLEEIINLAIDNNLDVAIQRINPKIAATEYYQSKAIFDPVLSVDSSQSKSLSREFSEISASSSEYFTFTTSVNQKLSPGTSYTVKFENTRYESNLIYQSLNPVYQSKLSFSVSQPLMKNFGKMVNESSIVIAGKNRDISYQQFKRSLIDIFYNVESVYWDLVMYIEAKHVADQYLKLAEDLLEMNRAEVRVGTLAPIDILQTEAEVAAREESVIIIQKSIEDAEELLKKMIYSNINHPDWPKKIYPKDRPRFKSGESGIMLEDEIKKAMLNRPDYDELKLRMEQANIQLAVAENDKLPTLDVVASYDLNGVDEEYRGNLDAMFSGDYYTWYLGLAFTYPFKNRSAKNAYLKTKIQIEQAILLLKNLEQQIIVEVREAQRRIITNRKRVDVTKVARKLAAKKLEAEEKKLKIGTSTNFNVLQYQKDLAEAAKNEVQAVIDYQKSLLNLQKTTGTLLEEKNVKLAEDLLRNE